MINNKALITVVSGLIFIPAIVVGSLGGVFFDWWLGFSRYESFAFAQSLLMGVGGGLLAGWLVLKAVGDNENWLYMIALPIIITILMTLPVFYPINLNDDWGFILSSYSAIFMYIYLIIKGEL